MRHLQIENLEERRLLTGSLGIGTAVEGIADTSSAGLVFSDVTSDGQFDKTTQHRGGGDRHMKFSDNNNPEPIDSIYYNYNYFDNTPLTLATQNHTGRDFDAGPMASMGKQVNRLVFGLERTFTDSEADASKETAVVGHTIGFAHEHMPPPNGETHGVHYDELGGLHDDTTVSKGRTFWSYSYTSYNQSSL